MVLVWFCTLRIRLQTLGLLTYKTRTRLLSCRLYFSISYIHMKTLIVGRKGLRLESLGILMKIFIYYTYMYTYVCVLVKLTVTR